MEGRGARVKAISSCSWTEGERGGFLSSASHHFLTSLKTPGWCVSAQSEKAKKFGNEEEGADYYYYFFFQLSISILCLSVYAPVVILLMKRWYHAPMFLLAIMPQHSLLLAPLCASPASSSSSSLHPFHKLISHGYWCVDACSLRSQ